jgi:hypothetical protein
MRVFSLQVGSIAPFFGALYNFSVKALFLVHFGKMTSPCTFATRDSAVITLDRWRSRVHPDPIERVSFRKADPSESAQKKWSL